MLQMNVVLGGFTLISAWNRVHINLGADKTPTETWFQNLTDTGKVGSHDQGLEFRIPHMLFSNS